MGKANRRANISYENVLREAQILLGVRGALSSSEICAALGIRQPTFSRLIAKFPEEFLTLGSGRSLRYLAPRKIEMVHTPIPVFEVREDGSCVHGADLIPSKPLGFLVNPNLSPEAKRDSRDKPILFNDLPYFLEEMRPQGFLGRRVPSLYPDLSAPLDIRKWSGDHVIRYITRHGSNLVGNLVVGEAAFREFQEKSKPTAIIDLDRTQFYEKQAANVLASGDGGSSAAGEQPKFLVSLFTGKEVENLLVKFSPPLSEPLGQRVSDLLVCEHIASEVLEKAGVTVAKTRIVRGDQRTFLEVERFDRLGANGRKGFLSLSTIDAEFAAVAGSWRETARGLYLRRIIGEETLKLVDRLDLFGDLIANNDRHNGNLAVWYSLWQKPPLELAPVYDMLPMFYMPRQNQLVDQAYVFTQPLPNEGARWKWAQPLALDFWNRVASDQRISVPFRTVSLDHVKSLNRLGALLRSWS